MKIATYNIQNLFHRHIALMNVDYELKYDQRKDEFEALLQKQNRRNSDFERMRELANLLRLHDSINATMTYFDNTNNCASNRKLKNQGNRPDKHHIWKGWNNMCTVPISLNSISNKLKVIFEANPDILLLQEVESRASLIHCNNLVFKERQETGYKEIIHLDGNDDNGLGMGILLKEGYRIRAIRSFSSERDIDGSFLFTNDLQSYKIETPIGQFVYVLSVQLVADSDDGICTEKRMRQAKMVSRVYDELRLKGNNLIVVMGTFNAPKYSKSISPILETDMTNISELSNFEVELDTGKDSRYYSMGAYRKGVNFQQLDYLLASPEIKDRAYASGMNRKAVWPSRRPEWGTYSTIKSERDSASEHPLLWLSIDMTKSISVRKLSA